ALLIVGALGHIAVSSYLCARSRDWPHAMAGLLQVIFFITPILFPAELLAERQLGFIYEVNPLYYLIDVVRRPMIGDGMPPLFSYVSESAYVMAGWVAAAITACLLSHRVVFLL